MTTATSRKSTARSRSREHRNEVTLVGELAAAAEDRVHAGGAEVTTFRLLVRQSGADGEPGPAERIDCVARTDTLRTRIAALTAGDVLEIDGALRHRYWRAGGALADRYEVEVARCRRIGRK